MWSGCSKILWARQDLNLGPTDYEPIQQNSSACLCIARERVRDYFKKRAMLFDCSPYL